MSTLLAALRALGVAVGLVRALTPSAAPAPLLTYRKAHGGWLCTYRGGEGFGLTKRDAARNALRDALRDAAH